MSYSAIAIQELMLYHNYPSIYWNTATLTVNSGSIDDDEILDFGEDDEEIDEEVERIKRKTKSTDYGRVASAISKLQHNDVTVELPLINQADFSFTPDEQNNRIIFGLKGILGINDDVANTIINLRPFKSFQDFYDRVSNIKEDDSNGNVKIGNSKIITLIKAGAFDELEGRSRIDIMRDFIKIAIEPRVKLDFRSIKTILDFGIIPDKYSEEVRMINFRNHVLRRENLLRKDEVFKSKSIYTLSTNDGNISNITEDFFNDNFISHLEEDKHYWYDDNGNIELYDTDLRNCIDKQIESVKLWLNTQEALDKYNNELFEEHWNKYCEGTVSKWEMDSVSFYSHDHELEHINAKKYNIVDFDTVPVEPKKVGSYRWGWGGREIDEYAIYRIAGTVLDRDKTKHTVSLLTTTGVTTLKLYSGSFAHYDRQITEQVFEKGKQINRVIEPSWFKRGTLLSVVGFRRGDLFIPKKYRGSIYQHTIQKITEVNEENGDIRIQSEREHDR